MNRSRCLICNVFFNENLLRISWSLPNKKKKELKVIIQQIDQSHANSTKGCTNEIVVWKKYIKVKHIKAKTHCINFSTKKKDI